ncbi:MAG TPA: hypothetical protein VMQ62_05215 [Dongiaceae bacterium]|nr:hypothetical protein [Dongiaceae bacterium]
MKKILVLVIVLVVAWVGYNFMNTGKLTLLPGGGGSPEEAQIRALESELHSVESQIESAGRAAGMTGMDTTADVGALTARKEAIEKQIAELKAKAGK